MSFNENAFWEDHKAEMNAHKYRNPVIDGTKYYVGDEDTPFRGYDGHLFTIRFFDGTIVTTKNLRYNGEIPKSRLKDFPNNACFIPKIETHIKGVYLGDEIFWVMETGDILKITVKKCELLLDDTRHTVIINGCHKCNVNALNDFIFLSKKEAEKRADRFYSVEKLLGGYKDAD